MKKITVRHQGIVLAIYKQNQHRFVISDYTSGKRCRHVCPTEPKAREKAKQVCEALASGKKNLLTLSPFESEIRGALDALPVDVRLGRAVDIVADCCRIVEPEEIVAACRFWKDHKPDTRFSPKTAKEAVSEYLQRRKHLSERRQRTLDCYFNAFVNKFEQRFLHQITTADLKDLLFGRQGWSTAKTRNEVRGAIGLLYKDAQERGCVPKGYNPTADIAPERLRRRHIGVFLPWQVRQILQSLEDDLAIAMALWFFAGCRKENLTRIQFSSLRSALETGFLKISAEEDLKTGARCVRIEPNLRAWILWHLSRYPQASGPVLAGRYTEGRKLDNLTRKIACRSGLRWIANAPRHSAISMWLARGENVQTVARWAGNSLQKIQEHYWCRDESITSEIANDYFRISPPGPENVVPLPQQSDSARSEYHAQAAPVGDYALK